MLIELFFLYGRFISSSLVVFHSFCQEQPSSTFDGKEAWNQERACNHKSLLLFSHFQTIYCITPQCKPRVRCGKIIHLSRLVSGNQGNFPHLFCMVTLISKPSEATHHCWNLTAASHEARHYPGRHDLDIEGGREGCRDRAPWINLLKPPMGPVFFDRDSCLIVTIYLLFDIKHLIII